MAFASLPASLKQSTPALLFSHNASLLQSVRLSLVPCKVAPKVFQVSFALTLFHASLPALLTVSPRSDQKSALAFWQLQDDKQEGHLDWEKTRKLMHAFRFDDIET